VVVLHKPNIEFKYKESFHSAFMDLELLTVNMDMHMHGICFKLW